MISGDFTSHNFFGWLTDCHRHRYWSSPLKIAIVIGNFLSLEEWGKRFFGVFHRRKLHLVKRSWRLGVHSKEDITFQWDHRTYLAKNGRKIKRKGKLICPRNKQCICVVFPSEATAILIVESPLLVLQSSLLQIYRNSSASSLEMIFHSIYYIDYGSLGENHRW